MNVILAAVNVILFSSIAVALAYKYRQSGQAGFLWLAIPLVVLPLLGMCMAYWTKVSVDSFVARETSGVFPFSLVESGRLSLGSLISLLNGAQHVVWSASVLLGLLMFKQQRPTEAEQPAMEP